MALDITKLNIIGKVKTLAMIKQIRDASTRVFMTEKKMVSHIDSYAGGLILNGTGILGKIDTTGGHTALKNFRGYSSSQDYLFNHEVNGKLLDNVPGGFSTTRYGYIGLYGGIDRNQVLILNPNTVYRGQGSVVANPPAAANGRRLYVGHSFIDHNGDNVAGSYTRHFGLAKLAQDLVLGTDTHMYITRDGFMDDSNGNPIPPHTEWHMEYNTTSGEARGPIFWDHHYASRKVDQATGEDIPFTRLNYVPNPDKPAGFGYSKHRVYDLWVDGAVFELVGNHNGYTNVWRIPIKSDPFDYLANPTGVRHVGQNNSVTSTNTTIPKDTWLSRNWGGSGFKYCYLAGDVLDDPTVIYRYTGYMGGIDYSGADKPNCIPPGAEGARFLMLGSYGSAAPVDPEDKQIHSNINIFEDASVDLEKTSHGLIPEHYYYEKKKLKNGVPLNMSYPTKVTVPRNI